jgi:hypothetical protein
MSGKKPSLVPYCVSPEHSTYALAPIDLAILIASLSDTFLCKNTSLESKSNKSNFKATRTNWERSRRQCSISDLQKGTSSKDLRFKMSKHITTTIGCKSVIREKGSMLDGREEKSKKIYLEVIHFPTVG